MSRAGDGPAGSTRGPPPEETTDPRPRYLFPVDGDHPDDVLRVVCDLVTDAEAELYVASPVTVPEQTPLELAEPPADAEEEAAQFVLRAKQQCPGATAIDRVVGIGHHRDSILRDLVEKYAIATVVAEARPRSGVRSILGIEPDTDAGLQDACDSIVVSQIGQLDAVESVLVAVGRGPHSGMAIETGLALARQHGAALELFHVYAAGDEESRRQGEEVLDAGMKRVEDYEAVERTLSPGSDVPQSIVEYAQPFDVTVLGAPRQGLLRQFILGTIPKEVHAEADGTILIAHRAGTGESWLDRWI